ncbi:hypothetical protein QTJ18_13240 [Rhizobium sp. SSA_523]|nr:hypothetical protein QTJ18_13240 [Rhizobium sp. SSA_523]
MTVFLLANIPKFLLAFKNADDANMFRTSMKHLYSLPSEASLKGSFIWRSGFVNRWRQTGKSTNSSAKDARIAMVTSRISIVVFPLRAVLTLTRDVAGGDGDNKAG